MDLIWSIRGRVPTSFDGAVDVPKPLVRVQHFGPSNRSPPSRCTISTCRRDCEYSLRQVQTLGVGRDFATRRSISSVTNPPNPCAKKSRWLEPWLVARGSLATAWTLAIRFRVKVLPFAPSFTRTFLMVRGRLLDRASHSAGPFSTGTRAEMNTAWAPDHRVTLVPLLSVRHARVAPATVDGDSQIAVVIESGAFLSAGPDYRHENWELSGPGSLNLVAMPGSGDPRISGQLGLP